MPGEEIERVVSFHDPEAGCNCSSCRDRRRRNALKVGAALLSVWQQARSNHRTYSDMGDRESDIRFLTLGLTGEAGELANFVKKRWRDGDGHDEAIHKEIADVLAYAFMLADTFGLTPLRLIDIIAEKQAVFIAKMKARQRFLEQSQERGEGE